MAAITTPLQRAKVKLRVIARLQLAANARAAARAAASGAAAADTIDEEETYDGSYNNGINHRRNPSQNDESSTLRSLSNSTIPLLPALPINSYDAQSDTGPDSRRSLIGRRNSVTDEVEHRGSAAKHDLVAVWELLKSSLMNILLVLVPLGYLAHMLDWPSSARFLLNFGALVPLALLLGAVTEDLALRFGDVIGGLLNATFGNVVELILSVAALQKGLYDVVAASLVGSVLSNLLLVLGCCFLVGGTQFHSQSFNAETNKIMCSLLFLSCIAFALPTAGSHLLTPDQFAPDDLLAISRGTAVMLILLYAGFLYFQLGTHKDLVTAGPSGDGDEPDEPEEAPSLSLTAALALLTAITVLVAFSSEFLTASIEEVSKTSGISRPFLGLIVLPIAGNACEHITAVFVAAKDKMDLAIGVALGSSIQIAVFVLPVVVLAGWVMGHAFTLSLDPIATMILILSVIHADFVSMDGSSNWLLGLQLCGTYVLISLMYFFRGS